MDVFILTICQYHLWLDIMCQWMYGGGNTLGGGGLQHTQKVALDHIEDVVRYH